MIDDFSSTCQRIASLIYQKSEQTWGPLSNLGAALAAVQAASLITDVEARRGIQKAALEVAQAQLQQLCAPI